MMRLLRHFRDHPVSVGETYLEHAQSAASFGVSMLRGALACFLHALVPALCVTVGSRIVARLHDRMIVNRARRATASCAPAAPQSDFVAEYI